MLYPQNGDRIVTIDSVTSLHPMHTSTRQWRVTNITISAHFTHLRKFRNFVFATEVSIFSDHNPLMYLRKCAPKSAKLTRWALGLQEFMHADSNIFHTSVVLFHIYTGCTKKVGAQTHGPILSWIAAIRKNSNMNREDRRKVRQAHQLIHVSVLEDIRSQERHHTWWKPPILTDLRIFFTGRFVGKFAVKWISKIPPHVAYVATRHGTGSLGQWVIWVNFHVRVIILTRCEARVFPVLEKCPKCKTYMYLKCWNYKKSLSFVTQLRDKYSLACKSCFLASDINTLIYLLTYLPCRVLEYSVRYSTEYSSSKKLDSHTPTHKSTLGVHYRTGSPGQLGLRVAGFPGRWVDGSQNVTQFHVWLLHYHVKH